MWQQEVSIFYTVAPHTFLYVCVRVPVKKEFREHAFHLGIPKMSVVCLEKRLQLPYASDLDLLRAILY